ncbi:MAG: hypothetical protein LRY37_05465 [Alkalibacterium thalassium]|uniref:Uncharacterized protein n=1 Tax=Alkalibacterium thalassium TaxID=426701 RepID=A0A1G9B671_9LACT|nr:hypothetical protein [Alkalibacterium thalassium]MCD8506470.1 hypothetical protein [Alkalibacterium thalassium]SDK35007.1 hypothetical protein SAMN04488098_102510 [Alkalibacterium thalassium]
MNYLELYNDVLIVVLEGRPTNAISLLKAINKRPIIVDALEQGGNCKYSIQFTFETLQMKI